MTFYYGRVHPLIMTHTKRKISIYRNNLNFSHATLVIGLKFD